CRRPSRRTRRRRHRGWRRRWAPGVRSRRRSRSACRRRRCPARRPGPRPCRRPGPARWRGRSSGCGGREWHACGSPRNYWKRPWGVGRRHRIGAQLNDASPAHRTRWNFRRVPRVARALAGGRGSRPGDAAVARLSEARHNRRSPPFARGSLMAELKEARVPDIGGYDDVPVIEVLVAVGDTGAKDQGLGTLESEKATIEVPAPFAGVVKEVRVAVDDKVSEGAVVAVIEAEAGGSGGDGEGAKAEAPAAAEPEAGPARRAQPEDPQERVRPAEEPNETEPAHVAAKPDKLAEASMWGQGRGPANPPVRFEAEAVAPGKVPYASPAVRLFARELGVELSQVSGSGRGGRIGKDDVQQFVKSTMQGGGKA